MSESTERRLIEIAIGLFVVAVIIFFWVIPMMPDRPERAGQSQSLNNLKPLTLAVVRYAQDNDGLLPGWVTLPDGQAAHNAWDQQIAPYVKSKDVFRDDEGHGIRSCSDPARRRVVSYGMNGLLITPAAKVFDGRADFRTPSSAPRHLNAIQNGETILFAELATDRPMPGHFGRMPEPAPDVFGPVEGESGAAWRKAQPGWIDISPRDFVENTPAPNCYREGSWDATNGVARDLYAGGGSYAFVDGHVKFMRIADALGANDRVPVSDYWSPDNAHNMWNPYRDGTR